MGVWEPCDGVQIKRVNEVDRIACGLCCLHTLAARIIAESKFCPHENSGNDAPCVGAPGRRVFIGYPQKDSVMKEFINRNVVIDVEAQFVYVGELTDVHEKTVILGDADVHDLRDSQTTREVYVLDTKVHGIRANRKRVFVARHKVVSISLLDDVVE